MSENTNTNVELVIPNLRLSFPHIWTAKSVGGGDPRFSANFLVEPGSKQAKLITKTIDKMVKEHFDGKLSADKKCLRDGNDKDYEGYADMLYLSAANKKRFTIVDRDGETPLTEEDARPYAGCYVNVVVVLWAQNSAQYGKRVNASLEGIQFVKDGEAFGGGVRDVKSRFADVTEDEDEDI